MDSKSGSSLCYDHFGYNANRVVSQIRSLLFVAAFDCCQTDWGFFLWLLRSFPLENVLVEVFLLLLPNFVSETWFECMYISFSSPWFSAAYGAGIVRKDLFVWTNKMSKAVFIEASNHCKWVFESAKVIYVSITLEFIIYQKVLSSIKNCFKSVTDGRSYFNIGPLTDKQCQLLFYLISIVLLLPFLFQWTIDFP